MRCNDLLTEIFILYLEIEIVLAIVVLDFPLVAELLGLSLRAHIYTQIPARVREPDGARPPLNGQSRDMYLQRSNTVRAKPTVLNRLKLVFVK